MTSIETLMWDANPIVDPSTEFSEEEIEAFDLLVRTRSGNVEQWARDACQPRRHVEVLFARVFGDMVHSRVVVYRLAKNTSGDQTQQNQNPQPAAHL